jgi:hypothetical protein
MIGLEAMVGARAVERGSDTGMVSGEGGVRVARGRVVAMGSASDAGMALGRDCTPLDYAAITRDFSHKPSKLNYPELF